MNKAEFENRFHKIIAQFGSKNFSQDRVTLIYDQVKYISADDLSRVFDFLVGNSRLAPMVQDFKSTVSMLGIRSIRIVSDSEPHQTHRTPPDYVYHLEANTWASNHYIAIRGPNVRACKFIIKSDAPDHPLVILDKEVRQEKLREIFNQVVQKTYGQKIENFKILNYDDFKTEGA